MNQSQSAKAVILLIDDETEVLDEVTAALAPTGYTCHCCTDGAAAIELARQTSPDLIVTDINIDGESGLELCERIKQDAELSDVPVIFLSGAQVPDVVRRSHAAGGTYYIRKPADPEVLRELVDKALWLPHVVSSQLQAN